MGLAILGTRGIPARYGGFETFAEELSTRLVARGIDVTVYCEESQMGEPRSHRGVKLKYVPAFPFGAASPIVSDAWALCAAAGRHSVLYMLGYSAPFVFWVPRLLGSTVWVNMDGIEWARAKWGWAARFYIKTMETLAVIAANRVIADASGVRDYLSKHHVRMAPCDVIPYGAPVITNAPDLGTLSRWGLSTESYYLVVCRLEPENHVLEIVRGFLESTTSRVLLIVGDHSTATKYVTMLKAYASPRVILTGAIYDVAQLQCLRFHAKAYLHGHSVGGTNPSLLEAMGCGGIVIAHDNIFNREVCGETAFYFSQQQDIPPLLDNVERRPREWRERKSAQARERVRTIYSWDRVVDQYVALLSDSHTE